MVDATDLNRIRREITRVTRSEAELKEFMFLLNQSNWTQIFEQDCKVCSACGTTASYSKMRWDVTYDIRICCPSCFKKTIDGYERQCDECGNLFFTHSINKHEMCTPCHTKKYGQCCSRCQVLYWPCYNTLGLCVSCREYLGVDENFSSKLYHKVLEHLRRARLLNLPATLTLNEWMGTLLHFDFLCAYCLTSPYEQLDHFIPLAKKGGTTKGNCVPSCTPCNKLKHQRHPDKVTTIPKEALNRVRSYLEQFS